MEIEDALHRCGGAARWSRLRSSGVTRHGLRTALAAERVTAAGNGTYALPGTDAAIVAAAMLSGVVSHASAARLHGLSLINLPRVIEVTVARGSRQRMQGIRVYAADLLDCDREIDQPVTALRRTVRDCARTMPRPHAVVLLDGVVRSERISMAELRTMAAASRGPGSTELRQAVGFLDAMAGSPIESLLRLLCELLPVTLETQVWISGTGPVDILLDGWLTLEADGFAFHSSRQDYRRDRGRGNVLAERRLTLLRFTYEDLAFRPGAVLAQIVRTLEARRPGSCRSLLGSSPANLRWPAL